MFEFIIVIAFVMGLLLPLTTYYFYQAVKDKSLERIILTAIALLANVAVVGYSLLFVYAALHISV